MGVLEVILIFLAAGSATFPLTVMAVRTVVSIAAPARATPGFHDTLDKALSWSIAVWIVVVMLVYSALVMVEWTKPCEDQRTNQLTMYCKKWLGAVP